MKLYLNKASPYARLVLVVAHEKALAGRLKLVGTDPWSSDASLLAVTPLSRVPVLIARDGQPLVESGCICEYLDTVGDGPALIPGDAAARVTMLRKFGLGRGLIDVAFGAVIQKRYAAGADPMLIERWRAAVRRTAGALENDETLRALPDMGDLAVAVALSYVDFRLGDIHWREAAPKLAAWLDGISRRPSMVATAPD